MIPDSTSPAPAVASQGGAVKIDRRPAVWRGDDGVGALQQHDRTGSRRGVPARRITDRWPARRRPARIPRRAASAPPRRAAHPARPVNAENTSASPTTIRFADDQGREDGSRLLRTQARAANPDFSPVVMQQCADVRFADQQPRLA